VAGFINEKLVQQIKNKHIKCRSEKLANFFSHFQTCLTNLNYLLGRNCDFHGSSMLREMRGNASDGKTNNGNYVPAYAIVQFVANENRFFNLIEFY
jgi:hypothetical protein